MSQCLLVLKRLSDCRRRGMSSPCLYVCICAPMWQNMYIILYNNCTSYMIIFQVTKQNYCDIRHGHGDKLVLYYFCNSTSMSKIYTVTRKSLMLWALERDNILTILYWELSSLVLLCYVMLKHKPHEWLCKIDNFDVYRWCHLYPLVYLIHFISFVF